MEVTPRELEQAERDIARVETQAAAAESAAGEYGKRLAALRRRLDDLILQIADVQDSLDGGDFDAARYELDELWITLHAVDRRFKDLLA